MNPLKLTRKKLAETLVESELQQIVQFFSSVIKPVSLYLFGSASEGKMTDQSDYDLLVIVPTLEAIRPAQKSFSKGRPELPKRAFDVVWLTEEDFNRKKEIGGVALIAATEGRRLI